jgi:BMFP domain-containing protein YqiC
MQTKMLVKKPEPYLNRKPVNNYNNKSALNKKDAKKDYKKLLQIMLNDPDAITREEFLFLQSIIGYRRAVAIREEAKLRKKQRKLGQTNVAIKPISLEISNSEVKKDSDGEKETSEIESNNQKIPLQMKKNDGNTATSNHDMPHDLRAGLENLSGVDLSNIKVHKNSDRPQQVGALAYTQGNDIYIAPGQERHLPHEGWHAIQQKQGRVEPTIQLKTGTPVNDDAGLEKEADVMGSRAKSDGLKSNTVQLKKTSQMMQESKIIQRITQEEAMRKAKENTHDANTGYSWNIKAGEYNRYVMEAQDMLRDIGYNLSKHGVDGKWSSGGETYNALLKFQKACKDTYNGLMQNAPPQTLVQVKYMQGVEPTGKLDKATYNALKKEKGNKLIRIKEENERTNKKKKELASNTNNKLKKTTEDNKQDNSDADGVLDGIQTVIDVIGFVPGVGDMADGVNVGISIVRKDWLGAVFSGIALIPMIGSAIATPMKTIAKASKVGKFSKVVTNAIELLVKLLGGASRVISKLSGYLEDLKGILRRLPELIKSAAEIKLVKKIAGNKVIQKIIKFADILKNGVDTICKKADEIFTKVKNAVAPEIPVKKAVDKGTIKTSTQIANSSPIKIPSSANIVEQTKTAYNQIKYTWSDGTYKFEARWHTRTPGAPAGQGDTWVVTRTTPGNAAGQQKVQHIMTGENQWTPMKQWQDAVTARQNGTATLQQQQLLDSGHWPAP